MSVMSNNPFKLTLASAHECHIFICRIISLHLARWNPNGRFSNLKHSIPKTPFPRALFLCDKMTINYYRLSLISYVLEAGDMATFRVRLKIDVCHQFLWSYLHRHHKNQQLTVNRLIDFCFENKHNKSSQMEDFWQICTRKHCNSKYHVNSFPL